MPDRQQIMNRAWAIMADRPRNRINWVYALRQAWQEAKDAARRVEMSEADHRAAVTRTRRHPHLMPVWDVDAAAPRSVNLATVSRIAAGGAVHTYQ